MRIRQIAQSEAFVRSDELKPVIDQPEQVFLQHVREIERLNKPGRLTPTEIEVIRLAKGRETMASKHNAAPVSLGGIFMSAKFQK